MDYKQINSVISTHIHSGAKERADRLRWMDWYLTDSTDRDYGVRDPYERDTDGRDDLTLETNYPYAFIDTMTANVCPTNPQVTIIARNPDMAEVARYRESLANDTLRGNDTHSKSLELASHAAIAGFGASKVVWSERYNRPRLLIVQPDNFIWDRTSPQEDWRYCGECTPITKEEFKARCKRQRLSQEEKDLGFRPRPAYKKKVADSAKFSRYPEWLVKGTSPHDVAEQARDVFEWVSVWEFWDFEAKKFYHILEGVEEPLLEIDLPYEFVENPYDIVVFNNNLKDGSGISDIKLIQNSQARLNELDTIELWHAQTTLPKAIVDKAALEQPADFERGYATADGPGAVVMASFRPNKTLRDAIQYSPSPGLSPSFDKMRGRATEQIEFTLGLAGFQRGQQGFDKATEAALANTAQQTRNGKRIKAIENWIASISKKMLGLWAEFADPGVGIPVSEPGSSRAEILAFADLAFDDAETFENEWWFDFKTAPYSPTENHRLTQLQKLTQYMQVLANNPHVDQGKLMLKILELLGMTEVADKTGQGGQPQQMIQAGGSPGVPGSSGVPGVDPVQEQMRSMMQGAIPQGPGDEEPI